MICRRGLGGVGEGGRRGWRVIWRVALVIRGVKYVAEVGIAAEVDIRLQIGAGMGKMTRVAKL